MARYAEFLNDRNLLVNHGGIYTLKYSSQKFAVDEMKMMSNWNSLTINGDDIEVWSEFLLTIAKKLAHASVTALRSFATNNKINLVPEAVASIEALAWGFDDE